MGDLGRVLEVVEEEEVMEGFLVMGDGGIL